MDAQHVLPRGTPQEVAENVRQNVRALMPGGGYVFNNVHNIQGEVPPENIVALFDTAYEVRVLSLLILRRQSIGHLVAVLHGEKRPLR